MTTWHAIGLDDLYGYTENNGRRTEMRFKNVAITNHEDITQATWIIWDRVWKHTEQEDIKRIKAIVKVGENL